MPKNIRVINELPSGRNVKFYDPTAHKEMSRTEFVKQIEKGRYPSYHIREINGVKIPVSNPDKSENNNLG